MELLDTTLVLVAVMPQKRDMEIARLLGWYRIPLKTAPRILHPDLIAFYQTAAFSEGHRSRIESFAEARGVELTTRAALFRDEPDHVRAKEEYYKIQLGPLQSLPQPILADQWKRFTFFYTTGERLEQAQTLRDLAMNHSERGMLWSALRERQAESGELYQTGMDETAQDLPQELLFLLGNLSLSGLDME